MGIYDSSATRVKPVFQILERSGPAWLDRLLALPIFGHPRPHQWVGRSLEPEEVVYGHPEKALPAPVALLEWLLSNANDVTGKGLIDTSPEAAERRRLLLAGDAATIEEGRRLLRSGHSSKQWYVLEGSSYPDVYIRTRDLTVVIEGKRTESGPTTSTTWMSERHQMLRHLDGALEMANGQSVLGFFIVEADTDGNIPKMWADAAKATFDQVALAKSLPHRTVDARDTIARGFLGVTTWRAVCQEFGIDQTRLPHTKAAVYK